MENTTNQNTLDEQLRLANSPGQHSSQNASQPSVPGNSFNAVLTAVNSGKSAQRGDWPTGTFITKSAAGKTVDDQGRDFVGSDADKNATDWKILDSKPGNQSDYKVSDKTFHFNNTVETIK
jgi:hypothetical protein